MDAAPQARGRLTGATRVVGDKFEPLYGDDQAPVRANQAIAYVPRPTAPVFRCSNPSDQEGVDHVLSDLTGNIS
jgi:hypothetical protein